MERSSRVDTFQHTAHCVLVCRRSVAFMRGSRRRHRPSGARPDLRRHCSPRSSERATDRRTDGRSASISLRSAAYTRGEPGPVESHAAPRTLLTPPAPTSPTLEPGARLHHHLHHHHGDHEDGLQWPADTQRSGHLQSWPRVSGRVKRGDSLWSRMSDPSTRKPLCASANSSGVFRSSVRPLSVNTYFAWRDIAVRSDDISTKLETNNHHLSRNCWKGFQDQTSQA